MMHRMTKNPRITVTLTPSTHALLRRLSSLTGESQSAIVSDLLDRSAPIFERVVKVLQAAEQARAQMTEGMARELEDVQRSLEQQLGLVLDEMDALQAGFLADAEAVKRRRREAVTAGS